MPTSTNVVMDIGPVTNDAAETIAFGESYGAEITLRGASDMLFHRWSNEQVAAQASAAKNSKGKKTDNLESYVYRTDGGNLGIPGEYLRMAIITAAKFRADPRSPRKSAMDLYKAGIVSLSAIADLGIITWDYEDSRRVTIQRAGITRTRPAIREGWEATFHLAVLLPEYIRPVDLQDVIYQAGRLVGIGDFRPTFGRFVPKHFEITGI